MIKRIIRKMLWIPRKIYRTSNAKRVAARLASSHNPKLKAIGEALGEALAVSLSPEEKQLVDRIEQRRALLLRSEQTIEAIDYGAGNADSRRTREEMNKGVRSTALVGKVSQWSKPAFWALVLFKLVRKLEPKSSVELGTCVGISAAYMSAALKLNGKGRLLSLEGSPAIADIARETLRGMKLENCSVITGPFYETLKASMESAKPIDFFFNDGHHDHDAVIQYFSESLPNLADQAVIVFDDISWNPGMRKAWVEIESHPQVSATIDLETIGIALVSSRPATKKEKYRMPL
jgi:predicted O-methyltransferase YrrM